MYFFNNLIRFGKKVVDFIWKSICNSFSQICFWVDSILSSTTTKRIIDGMICFINDAICLSKIATKSVYNWFKTKFLKSETTYRAENFSNITKTTKTYVLLPDDRVVERTETGKISASEASIDVIQALLASQDDVVKTDDREIMLAKFEAKAREQYGLAVLQN